MHNNHIKQVEVNTINHTIRVGEVDRRGKVWGVSKFVNFNSGLDAMKMTLAMHGYKFHRGGSGVLMYTEV